MPRRPFNASLVVVLAGSLAGLAAAPTAAHAWTVNLKLGTISSTGASVNLTEPRCWNLPTSDESLVSSDQATLLWTTDGELRLKPTNSFVDYLWSSGTAGVGVAACYRANGSLVVKDASGTVIWSKTGASVPIYQNRADSYVNRLTMEGCSLTSGYTRYFGSTFASPETGTLWTEPRTCPTMPDSLIKSGWCMDTSEEQVLARTRWSELAWTTDGNLSLRGLGSAAGTELWRAGFTGTAAKLCFEDTGRLAIYSAGGGVIWSQGAPGATSTYYLGLDDCSIETRAVAGGNQLWSKPVICPQSRVWNNRAWTRVLGAGDRIILENDDATLVQDGVGDLSLRDRTGNEYWNSSGPFMSAHRIAFQADGNLVVYGVDTTTVKFASDTDGKGVNIMALEGCALRLYAGTVMKWQVGSPSCAIPLDNSTPWSLPTKGDLTLARTPEAKLIWQADGNLVLYTLGDSVLWASNTSGRGRRLSFQADGNLVIYSGATSLMTGQPIPVWATGTNGVTGPLQLSLGDECTLSIENATTAIWTGNHTCKVTQYSFVKEDGDRTLGSFNRSALTSELSSGVARLENAASFEVSLLGRSFELLAAQALRSATAAGVESEQATVTVLGESGVSPNIKVEKLFVGSEQTYFLGPVPVVVKYGVEGELGLSIAADDGALVATPHGGLFLMAEAAVGSSVGPIGASAGLEGSITIVEVALPFRLDITTSSSGHHTFDLRADVHIETLTGTLAIFAKAYVKVLGVKVSAKWSHELFGWKGLSWDKNLFQKTGDF